MMVAVKEIEAEKWIWEPTTRNLPLNNQFAFSSSHFLSDPFSQLGRRLIILLILKTWSPLRLPFVISLPLPHSSAPLHTMSLTLDGSPFALPTIPDMALLAIGQFDWYPAEPTGCTEPLGSSLSPSELMPFSSPLPELEAQSPLTADGSPELSPPSSDQFKSRPKSSGVVRQKRNIDLLPPATYPYTRPEAKKDVDGVKRRKVWDHMLERRLFTPEEL